MKKSNILLVDDDEVYLFITKRILNSLSKTLIVNEFTDGEKAIDYIGTCQINRLDLPDIILLDINMPFLDGWGFLTKFKQLKPSLKTQDVNIYLVSSSNDPADIKRAQDFEDITGYVVKPVFEEKLEEILKDTYKRNI